MKDGLTVNKIALGNLKTRKKQYTVMIIGIILAMIFSSSSILFVSCIKSSNDELKKIKLGSQDYVISNVNDDDINRLKQEYGLKDYYPYETLGYAYNGEEKFEKGVSVAKLDESARDYFYLSFVSGGFPQNEGEIAIEESALSLIKKDAVLGDKIELDFMVQNGGNYLEKPIKKEYKLVGIVNDKRANALEISSGDDPLLDLQNFPAAYVSEAEKIEPGGKARTDIFVFQKNFGKNEYDKLLQANADIEHIYVIPTTSYYSLNGGYSSAENTAIVGAIFACIFFVASSVAIINSFTANLNDRKKQIGMLKTVGATSRQIINIYGREAFIIALATMPVSILISYLALKLLTGFIKDVFIFSPKPYIIALCCAVSLLTVLLSAFIPLLGASRVSPMQSIRNVEYSYKLKRRKIKSSRQFNSSKLIAKRSLIFKRGRGAVVSVLLIVVILASGFSTKILYAMFGDNYIQPFDYTISVFNNGYYTKNYNFASDAGYSENDKRDILLNPYIKEAYASRGVFALINKKEFSDYDRTFCYQDGNISVFDINHNDDLLRKLTKENCNELLGSKYTEDYEEIKSRFGISNELMPVYLNGIDSGSFEIFKKWLVDGKINMDKLLSGEEVVLVAPQKSCFVVSEQNLSGKTYYTYGAGDFQSLPANVNVLLSGDIDYAVGDELDLSVFSTEKNPDSDGYGNIPLPDDLKKTDKTVKIGAICTVGTEAENGADIYEYFHYTESGIYLFCSNNLIEQICPGTRYTYITLNANGEIDDDKDEKIVKFLEQLNPDTRFSSYIRSNFELENEQKNNEAIAAIVYLSVLVLFLSICSSLINNSLTAQIRAEKRQIGTLRAVGASMREIVRAYILQLISMLSKGTVIGFAAYCVSNFVFIKVQDRLYGVKEDFGFYSLIPAAVSCLLLFLLCSVNLLFKIRKETKNSIIDNIREL